MTPTETQIRALLERKRAIERMPITFTEHHRWLLDAVEVLLRHQIELREELRNNGILR